MLCEALSPVVIILAVCNVEFVVPNIDTLKGEKITATSGEFSSSNDVKFPKEINGKCKTSKNSKTDKWWQIDLGKKYFLKFMNIHHIRYNKQYLYFSNVYVANVSATDGGADLPYNEMSMCGAYDMYEVKNSIRSISCEKVFYARFVIIVHNRVNNTFHCKWEIFHVCPKGTWGNDCKQKCNCRDDGRCNATDGTCNTGCRDYTYGISCGNTCGKCLFGKPCDTITGKCPDNLCEPGFTGSLCDRPCLDGFYGFKCTDICICPNVSEVCNNVDGKCTSGCAKGWMNPPVCDIPCAAGKYGFNCTQVCKTCFKKTEICHHVTGKCSLCKSGKQPPSCEKDCVGKYGSMCRFDCQCRAKYCDPVTGACAGDCAFGYINDDKSPFKCRLKICDEVGKHGLKCDKVCHCKNKAPCAQMTGRCPNGCAKNVGGKYCHLSLSAAKLTANSTGVIAGGITAALILAAIGLYVAHRRHGQESKYLYLFSDPYESISRPTPKTATDALDKKQQTEENIQKNLESNINTKDCTSVFTTVDQHKPDDKSSRQVSVPKSIIKPNRMNKTNVDDQQDGEIHSQCSEKTDVTVSNITDAKSKNYSKRSGRRKRRRGKKSRKTS